MTIVSNGLKYQNFSKSAGPQQSFFTMVKIDQGTRIDQYEVRDYLGSGTIGSVFTASSIEIPTKVVAIKILSDELVSHDRAFTQFRHQFSQIYRLAEEHHVKIEKAFRDGPFTGYSMELASEGNLSIRRQQGQSEDNLIPDLEILLELANAINSFHQRGMILRGVKPTNILVTSEGRVKLADVGLSLIPSLDHLKSKSYTAVSKLLPYLSPEYLLGMKLDARADLYSFGVIAYELLTGELPFETNDAADLLGVESREAIVPLTQRAPEIPPQLEELIWNSLRVNPNYRYQSAATLFVELAHIRDNVMRDRQLKRFHKPIASSSEDSKPATIMIDGKPLEIDDQQDPKYEKGTRRKPRSGTFLWRQGIPEIGEN